MAGQQPATPTSQGGAAGLAFDALLDGLKALGTEIAQGFARFAYIITQELAVGTPEKPTGITMYDKVTGEAYCFSIADGAASTTPGVCTELEGIIANATSTDPIEDGDAPEESPPIVVNTLGGNAILTPETATSTDAATSTSEEIPALTENTADADTSETETLQEEPAPATLAEDTAAASGEESAKDGASGSEDTEDTASSPSAETANQAESSGEDTAPVETARSEAGESTESPTF